MIRQEFFQFLILNLIKEIKVDLSNCYKKALLPVYMTQGWKVTKSIHSTILLYLSFIRVFPFSATSLHYMEANIEISTPLSLNGNFGY